MSTCISLSQISENNTCQFINLLKIYTDCINYYTGKLPTSTEIHLTTDIFNGD